MSDEINRQTQDTQADESGEQERVLTPEEEEQERKERAWAVIADQIRDHAKREQYMTLTEFCEQTEIEREEAHELLEEMRTRENYKDICVYQGAKDFYYYTYPTLAHNYVRTLAMAQEDDLESIIAQTVRYESKTYPRATEIATFSRAPYHYTQIQVQRMLDRMKGQEAYADLETYVSGKKNIYIFSTKYLSRRYAASLVEMGEDKRMWL